MKKILSLISLLLVLFVVSSSFALARGNGNDIVNQIPPKIDDLNNINISDKDTLNLDKSNKFNDLNLNQADVLKLNKLSSKDITLIFENTQKKVKSVNIVKEKIQNIFVKRNIDEDKLNQIENNFKQSNENYNKLNENLNENKQQLQKSIQDQQNCKINCDDIKINTIALTKTHTNNLIDLMIESINKIDNKILESEKISQENVDTLNILNQEKIQKLNEFKLQINSTNSLDEIKNIWQDSLNFWNKDKNQFNQQIILLKANELNSILIKIKILETKIENLQNEIINSNQELTTEFTTSINDFSNLISDAEELYDEFVETIDVEKSNELHKEINNKLKQANEIIVKEILPFAKQKLNSNKVQEILQTNSNDEVEILQVEYEQSNESEINSIVSASSMRNILVSN